MWASQCRRCPAARSRSPVSWNRTALIRDLAASSRASSSVRRPRTAPALRANAATSPRAPRSTVGAVSRCPPRVARASRSRSAAAARVRSATSSARVAASTSRARASISAVSGRFTSSHPCSASAARASARAVSTSDRLPSALRTAMAWSSYRSWVSVATAASAGANPATTRSAASAASVRSWASSSSRYSSAISVESVAWAARSAISPSDCSRLRSASSWCWRRWTPRAASSASVVILSRCVGAALNPRTVRARSRSTPPEASRRTTSANASPSARSRSLSDSS